jgi:hypothetical protein
MDSVKRLAIPSAEQAGDGFIGEDHHLLDERMGERLGLDPGALDAALVVESECRLPRLDSERAARVAPPPQLGRDALGKA